MTTRRKTPTVPKPRRKPKEPKLNTGQFMVQLGRTRHPDYVHRFDSDKKARAWAIKAIDRLEPDLRRWNQAGIEVLDLIKRDIEAADFGRRPVVITRTIDDYTGQDVYVELWRES